MRKGILVGLTLLLIPTLGLLAREPLAKLGDPVATDEVPAFPLGAPQISLCDGNCARPGEPNNRLWIRSDSLLWWVKRAPNPVPLVSTGPFDPNTFVLGVSPTPGAVGSTGTQILAGNENVPLGSFSGQRIQGGWWLDSERQYAIEVSGFLLAQRTKTFTAASDTAGVPFLGVPFFDPSTGTERTAAFAFANDAGNIFGGLLGKLSVDNQLRLWGTETSLAVNAWRNNRWSVDLSMGFRYADLEEALSLTGVTSPIGQPLFGGFAGTDVAPGQSLLSFDRFHTRNQFYGGQFGARVETALFDGLEMELATKLSLGNTCERIDIQGLTSLLTPGVATATLPGGTLAQPSNIGTYRRSGFSVIPEVNLNLAYQLTSWLRLRMGYSFLYWSDVVRPGDQVDHAVDSRQIVSNSAGFVPNSGAISPMAHFERSGFFAQGVNVGVELRY